MRQVNIDFLGFLQVDLDRNLSEWVNQFFFDYLFISSLG